MKSMQKIILIEDIVQVTLEIKNNLSSFDVRIFNSARSFLEEFQKQSFKDFLSQTDFFLLDFNLGDASLISSNIYEIILANKKKESVLCCISSFGQHIVDKNCEEIALKFKQKQPFHYYLRKSPELICEFIINFTN